MAMVKSGDYTFAFPTVVLRRVLPDVEEMNAGLLAAVLAERAAHAGISRSNVKAWHSSLSWFKQEDAALAAFRDRLKKVVHEYWAMDQQRTASETQTVVHLVGWAMAYEKGGYAIPHNHPNANFSGVYYVDAGDFVARETVPLMRSKSGVLSLLDPRVAAQALQTDGYQRLTSLDVTPEDGLLVMFPAWLMHHVHPYEGERPRVALAFNVTVTKTGESPP